MSTTSIAALRFDQKGSTLYLASMTVAQLLAHAVVPRYNPKDGSGYQRLPPDTRLASVSSYIAGSDKALFPTTVLLSAREPLNFTPSTGDHGNLKLDTKKPLFVVDGQTRILSLQHAINKRRKDEFQDLRLGVVIAEFGSEIEEMVNFRTINREAKSVSTALTDRLISKQIQLHMEAGDLGELSTLLSGKLFTTWQLVRIAQQLNERPSSAWRGLVKIPNAPNAKGATISERSLTTSIKPVIAAMPDVHDSTVADAIVAFWTAMDRVCPEAAADPKAHALYRKTMGAYVGHLVMAKILTTTTDRTADGFEKELRRFKLVTSGLWKRDGPLKGLGGQSGFKDAAEKILATKK